MTSRPLVLIAALMLGGCGAASAVSSTPTSAIPQGRPQAIQPAAGVQPVADGGTGASAGADPVGDPNAHAPSLDEVRHELRLQLIAVRVTNARYINPLRYVTVWGRTDQGVDAAMPVGAPILAPCKVKVLATIPNWFAGQPLVYFELLRRARCRQGAIRGGADHQHRAGRHPPAGTADRSVCRVRHEHRIRLGGSERRDARACDHRLHRGSGHAGRSFDPRLAEQPRRERGQGLVAN